MPSKIEYKVERSFLDKGPSILEILYEYINENNKSVADMDESEIDSSKKQL